MGASRESHAEPVAHSLARAADVARQATAILLGEARERGVAEREVSSRLVGVARELPCARPAAVVAKRRVHNEAPALALEDRQRKIAVVTMVEAVALVEAA